MKTILKKTEKTYRRKLLATSITAVVTTLLATSVSQASDIDIYQEAKSGKITLMMLFDISGSMSNYDSFCDKKDSEKSQNGTSIAQYDRDYCITNKIYYFGKMGNNYYSCGSEGSGTYESCSILLSGKPDLTGLSITPYGTNGTLWFKSETRKSYTRITRLKDAMFDLLYGNRDKKIEPLADDKVIGLSAFSYDGDDRRGYIIVPARTLDQKVGGKTQRTILLEKVASLKEEGGTPTAHAYAETAAYMLGTTTKDVTYSGFSKSEEGDIRDKNNYKKPSSLTQVDASKQCSGQGIYVLTDGSPNGNDKAKELMQKALSTKSSSFSCRNSGGGWNCMHNFVGNLLNPTKNPAGLTFKTAVVGFGSSFNGVASYDSNKTYEENIAPFVEKNSDGSLKKDANGEYIKLSNLNDVQNAAYWGVIGGGGWYSGSSSQDVVDSVNNFINGLSTTIPSVTTGSPTIPKDALNPAFLQNDAYYQQFQPTPDKSYQLWLGNLKKYLVTTGGVLKGKDGQNIVDADGKILDNYDYWAASVVTANEGADADTVGSKLFALRGGAWSRLMLRTDPLTGFDDANIQRRVLTNRVATGIGSSATFGGTTAKNAQLRQVKPTDLTDTTYQHDPKRGYLVRMLGYNIDAATPPATMDDLKTGNEFRQMGAVMHSYPLLVTNKGKLAFNSTTKQMESKDREDYILFGSTQGVLHVVEAGKTGVAGGGKEIFAFVPNEMLDKQQQAFEKPETTKGGTNKLFYGIDGAWTAYTEYVLDQDNSGSLSVGDGKGGQKGVQDVYGGLRMGGRSYYALDLKDIKKPKLKFHINPDAATAGTPLSYMGQSWSKPSIGFVNWKGKRTRVMFVGGGYDMGYELANYNQENKEGAGVYMFRAEDEVGSNATAKAGELLWWGSANATDSVVTTTSGVIGRNHAEMKYSVVSEIRTVDRDGDDLIDHLYFGDLGGQIWRVDLDNKQNVIGNVVKKPVRLFNGHLASGKSPRFYDMPAFSLYSDSGNIIAVISQGSGNRSKPLFADSSYSYDAMYNIYDKDVARKNLFSATSWTTKDITALNIITDDDRKNNAILKAPFSSNGWYYQFEKCLAGFGKCDGYTQQTEKVFGTPIALNNKLFVSTFDASKDGLAGDCGAGVKGASLMTTFCMPYGQCKVGDITGTTRNIIGAGIHTITVGNDITDPNGGGTGGGGSGGGSDDEKKVASSQNYCVDTGGRTTITVTGGSSAGEKTRMCLIPQRWYPKLN